MATFFKNNKNITNDVYGDNMRREDAEPRAIRHTVRRPFRRNQGASQKAVGKNVQDMTIAEYNDYLHQLQRGRPTNE